MYYVWSFEYFTGVHIQTGVHLHTSQIIRLSTEVIYLWLTSWCKQFMWHFSSFALISYQLRLSKVYTWATRSIKVHLYSLNIKEILWWNCHHIYSVFQTWILTLYFTFYSLFCGTFIKLLLMVHYLLQFSLLTSLLGPLHWLSFSRKESIRSLLSLCSSSLLHMLAQN